jgi:hypothetical protein
LVGAGVGDGGEAGAGGAAGRGLGDLGGEGLLHGHVLLRRGLQHGGPRRGDGHAAVGRLVVVGVLEAAHLGAPRRAVRVRDALAPALEVAPEHIVHHHLQNDQQQAQRDRKQHQTAVRLPVPFLHPHHQSLIHSLTNTDSSPTTDLDLKPNQYETMSFSLEGNGT